MVNAVLVSALGSKKATREPLLGIRVYKVYRRVNELNRLT